MKRSFGPWATAMHVAPNPQLSTFWKRRVMMLCPTSQTSFRLSTAAVYWLVATGVLACALPTLRNAPLRAEEEPASAGAKEIGPEKTTGESKVQEVFAAWAARQERFRFAKFEWTQETIEPYRALLRGQPAIENAPKPGEMVVVKQSLTLRLDGDRFDLRYTTQDAVRLNKPAYCRSSYDGVTSRRFSQASRAAYRSSGTGIPGTHN